MDARIQLLTNYYSFTLLLIGLVLRFSSIGAFKGLPNRGREGERERERGREGEREGGREGGRDGEREGEREREGGRERERERESPETFLY